MVPAAPPTPEPVFTFLESWLPPVQGHLTSPFGPRGDELHEAVDIGAKMGSEVVAPAPLRIETIAYQKRAGRFVTAFVLDEDGKKTGWRLTFAHLSHVAVFEGDRVRRGARLGLIGHSGTATGPHLHLRLEMPTDEGGRLSIDPLALLTPQELTGTQDSAIQDSAIQDSSIQDSAIQASAVEDSPVEDSAIGSE